MFVWAYVFVALMVRMERPTPPTHRPNPPPPFSNQINPGLMPPNQILNNSEEEEEQDSMPTAQCTSNLFFIFMLSILMKFSNAACLVSE